MAGRSRPKYISVGCSELYKRTGIGGGLAWYDSRVGEGCDEEGGEDQGHEEAVRDNDNPAEVYVLDEVWHPVNRIKERSVHHKSGVRRSLWSREGRERGGKGEGVARVGQISWLQCHIV